MYYEILQGERPVKDIAYEGRSIEDKISCPNLNFQCKSLKLLKEEPPLLRAKHARWSPRCPLPIIYCSYCILWECQKIVKQLL